MGWFRSAGACPAPLALSVVSHGSPRTTSPAAFAHNFFALTLCCRKVQITSKVILCIPRLISIVPLVLRCCLVLLHRLIGTFRFPFLRLEEALLAQVHGVLLILVLGLHREQEEVLVRTLWSTGSVTATEPLHVRGGGPSCPLLHFFLCDLFFTWVSSDSLLLKPHLACSFRLSYHSLIFRLHGTSSKVSPFFIETHNRIVSVLLQEGYSAFASGSPVFLQLFDFCFCQESHLQPFLRLRANSSNFLRPSSM